MYSTKTLANSPVVGVSNTTCSPAIFTPQRKARYSDKNRDRLKDLKEGVLFVTGCASSAEIKKYLKMLGVKLDLRLTAAWKAIKLELQEKIKDFKNFLAIEVYEEKTLVSLEIQKLEESKQKGAIASFKEDEEGGMFWIWTRAESSPKIVTSSALTKFLLQCNNLAASQNADNSFKAA